MPTGVYVRKTNLEVERTCRKCGILKPRADFRPQRRWCIDCCGTYNKRYYKITDWSPTTRYNHSKGLAKKRGRLWEISKEEYVRFLSLPCHYCDGRLPTHGIGLDRKDNTFDYVDGNVVPCCSICNDIKGPHLTYEEMVLIMTRRKAMKYV